MGQGMIMGMNTCLSMLVGAFVGWGNNFFHIPCHPELGRTDLFPGILAPLAQYQGWAPGKTSSFSDGAQGWLLWISLAVMMAESVSSLFVLVIQWITHRITIYRSVGGEFLDDEEDPGVFGNHSVTSIPT